MNRDLGASLGVGELGQFYQSNSATVIDAGAICFALIAGVMLRDKRWGMLAGAGTLALLLGFASWTGVFGFGAKERIGKAATIELQNKTFIDAAKFARDEERKRTDGYLDWLKGTASVVKGTVTRTAYLEQATKIVLAPVAVHAPKIEQAMADPQAQVFTQLMQWARGGSLTDDVTAKQTEVTELKLIFMISLLVVSVKVMSFFFASAVWPREAIAVSVPEPREIEAPEPVKVEPEIKSAKVETLTPKAEPQKIEPQPQAAVTDLSRARERKIVEEFFSDELIFGKGGKAKAATVYQWFADWSRSKKHPLISNSQFGRICTEMQIERTTDGRHNFYAVQRRQPRLQKVA